MARNWRISLFSGLLIAAYFIPTWSVVAYRIMISPVQGLFERPNVAVAFFVSDHLQLASLATVRVAWLLALSKFTVVAFLAIFLLFAVRNLIRKTEGHREPLGIALTLGCLISFVSLILASKVGEVEALRLHATEFFMMLGTAMIMLIERPSEPLVRSIAATSDLSVEQAQLSNHG
jgi:hypothetical protein